MPKLLKTDINMEDNIKRMKGYITDFLVENEEFSPLVYLNLSNGIEALPILQELGIEPHFSYIRSSHFEQKSIQQAIEQLGADFLMNLALGRAVLVVDFGARKEYARAIYQGIPFIKYLLERLWYHQIPKNPTITPRRKEAMAHNCIELFDFWFRNINKKTRDKIKRYRKYTNTISISSDEDRVKLYGISTATIHDGITSYQIDIVKQWKKEVLFPNKPGVCE